MAAALLRRAVRGSALEPLHVAGVLGADDDLLAGLDERRHHGLHAVGQFGRLVGRRRRSGPSPPDRPRRPPARRSAAGGGRPGRPRPDRRSTVMLSCRNGAGVAQQVDRDHASARRSRGPSARCCCRRCRSRCTPCCRSSAARRCRRCASARWSCCRIFRSRISTWMKAPPLPGVMICCFSTVQRRPSCSITWPARIRFACCFMGRGLSGGRMGSAGF